MTELERLIAEHDRLAAEWDAARANGADWDGCEPARRAMNASWNIGLTQPGGRTRLDRAEGDPFRLEPEHGCQPTVLSAHRDDEDDELGHLMYRGACLGCGWVSDRVHLLWDGGENAAVEDAHDHTHPGWRDLPVVDRMPTDATGQKAQAALDRKRAEVAAMHPDGWADRHGPTRTLRQPLGTRHAPRCGWFGGYDLSAGIDPALVHPAPAVRNDVDGYRYTRSYRLKSGEQRWQLWERQDGRVRRVGTATSETDANEFLEGAAATVAAAASRLGHEHDQPVAASDHRDDAEPVVLVHSDGGGEGSVGEAADAEHVVVARVDLHAPIMRTGCDNEPHGELEQLGDGEGGLDVHETHGAGRAGPDLTVRGYRRARAEAQLALFDERRAS